MYRNQILRALVCVCTYNARVLLLLFVYFYLFLILLIIVNYYIIYVCIYKKKSLLCERCQFIKYFIIFTLLTNFQRI